MPKLKRVLGSENLARRDLSVFEGSESDQRSRDRERERTDKHSPTEDIRRYVIFSFFFQLNP